MKYIKMLGLAAMASAALMAFVGASTASATVLTSPPGTALTLPVTIEAVSEEKPVLTGGFKNVECEKSEVVGTAETESGGEISGPITTLTFGPANTCNCEVVVSKNGSLSISAAGGGNGTLKSTGAEVTVNCSTIFGKVHCIYVTNGTVLGTLTGTSTTGGTATMDITAEIPRKETSSLCAQEAIWHAKYKVINPDELDIS